MSDSTIKGYESNLNTHTGDNEEVTVTVDATNNETYFDVLDKNSVPAGAGSDYDGAALTVSTTEVEAKVGASRMTDRRGVLVHNNSTETIYFGPTGITTSTGAPLFPNQRVSIGIGDIGLFC